jgi:hypothetical protein
VAQFPVTHGKKVDSRKVCYWSHACKSCKTAGMGTNGIRECTIVFNPEHRTPAALRSCATRSCCNILVFLSWSALVCKIWVRLGSLLPSVHSTACDRVHG